MEDAIEPRELFGGAIGMCLPTRFVDISDFRPIPDHQEVFSDANMDQSLIVEVLVGGAWPVAQPSTPHTSCGTTA